MLSKRNYGIDLLRIVLMLFIILGHLYTHSDIRHQVEIFSPKWIATWGIQTITVCAVNCFVLITGYYTTKSTLPIQKLVKLWLTVWFYSVSIYVVLCACGLISFSLKGAISSLFPVLSHQYWFFSVFILLLVFIPFINKGLEQIKDSALKILCGIILAVFFVLPIFEIVFPLFDGTKGYGIINFVCIYIIGYSLRRLKITLKKRWCILGLVINNSIVFLSKIVLVKIVEMLEMDAGTSLFYNYNMIFQLINAALLMLFFMQIDLGQVSSKIVKILSVSVFSVYLIHEHDYIRPLLWSEKLRHFLIEASDLTYILICLVISISVFVICITIDIIRRGVIGFIYRTKCLKKFDMWLLDLEKKANDKL